MKINIYYGGRGLIEDPTLYCMNKIVSVFEELRVGCTKYNLYEQKNGISMLPKTLKECDACILAINVEWFGIGGLMQQFLDSCWLYGDKELIKKIYMMPLVLSSTEGEKEAVLTLQKAWELLGGRLAEGICAYAPDHVEFETNPVYQKMIEKRAEDLYRTVDRNQPGFPSSTGAVLGLARNSGMELTPQESEQLSIYVSDDTFVKKQKEDIEELSSMFREMLEGNREEGGQEYIRNFRENFIPPENEGDLSFELEITDSRKTLSLRIRKKSLHIAYEPMPDADVHAKLTKDIMNRLINGRITFQGAFMSGEISAKGDFKEIRTFDQYFRFNKLV